MDAIDFRSLGLLPFSLPKPIAALAGSALGWNHAAQTYVILRESTTKTSIAERLLQHLEVTYRVSDTDLAMVPRAGATLVISNHPFGILEGAVLATLLARIRPDVRILANDTLRAIPELRDLVIPVSLHGKHSVNTGGIRQAIGHLQAGGMLVVFPAGEVSHFHLKKRASMDARWKTSVARILQAAANRGSKPVTVPIFIAGANSVLFQFAGLFHPVFRTALLPRELMNKRRTTVDLRIGTPVPFEKLESMNAEESIEYLRWRSDLLRNRATFKPHTNVSLARETRKLEAIAPAISKELLDAEVETLKPNMLALSADLRVYIAQAASIPSLLQEIGRLRELAFRAVGEGTGRALDLDEFDQSYLHLFVWNSKTKEVAGAYRLSTVDHGPQSLYTHTLFKFDQAFLNQLGPAIELGRSFIRLEYQKQFAPLLLLWKGIGAFVASNPRCKILFGPVSISNQYHSFSRELMISFLEKRASLGNLVGFIRPRNKPARIAACPVCKDVGDLSDAVSDIEASQRGVPVLLRQYLRLGGKLLGFNVDPNFANVLDGLILVDLTQTEPKLLERYLGKHEAAAFLRFQKGQ